MNIGLFGGTFDPPHVAHLKIAEAAQEQFQLDQVWWIPALHPPHKLQDALTPIEHRLAMTRLAIGDNSTFVVSDIETRRSGPSFTIDTVRTVRREHPDHRFSLLLGGDSLANFSEWAEPDSIAALVPLIVYERPGFTSDATPSYLEGRVRKVRAPITALTGSAIRVRVREGKSIRTLVSEATRAYIMEHGLYRGPA